MMYQVTLMRTKRSLPLNRMNHKGVDTEAPIRQVLAKWVKTDQLLGP